NRECRYRAARARDPNGSFSRSDQSDFLADFAERVQRELQILPSVRGGHDRAHPRLVTRHRREADRLREYPFLEQSIRKRIRPRAVARDDRRNRALADPGVAAQTLTPCLSSNRIV